MRRRASQPARPGNHRRERLCEAFRLEINEIVRFELDDERVDPVIVHHVALNAAGTAARVYVSSDGGRETDLAATVRALNEATDFIRQALGQHLGLHRVPALHFVLDKTLLSASRIEAILDEERSRLDAADALPAADVPSP
ncbi:30S ribosome-binding factor RbfA [Chloracidobacterium sp. MS 40/45]|uniref:30S ribosome-binding factor RbfA n=1 Tax=Chloracidobacterium aggregatum TaxID=2851959 RepID=UPI001B8D24EC|nr:30S ribosome-binding factor RbfA [Chloracidobacterium aggregatum]QUW00486.1 30S ribosome-binding factor RbfA [Chloracidobacterium sp. MS 40/45]